MRGPAVKARKRDEAETRSAAYAALSPAERLSRALKRGHKDTREVARLRKLVG